MGAQLNSLLDMGGVLLDYQRAGTCSQLAAEVFVRTMGDVRCQICAGKSWELAHKIFSNCKVELLSQNRDSGMNDMNQRTPYTTGTFGLVSLMYSYCSQVAFMSNSCWSQPISASGCIPSGASELESSHAHIGMGKNLVFELQLFLQCVKACESQGIVFLIHLIHSPIITRRCCRACRAKYKTRGYIYIWINMDYIYINIL